MGQTTILWILPELYELSGSSRKNLPDVYYIYIYIYIYIYMQGHTQTYFPIIES